MEFDIDARGLTCPEPVIKTREALARGAGPFVILVDNEAARDNVSRFARSSGCEVEVSAHPDGFLVRVSPGEGAVSPGDSAAWQEEREPVAGSTPSITKVLFMASDEIGRGDRELGTTLARAFLYACTESEDRPSCVVFMNSAVRMVTENDETVEHVRRLESGGTEVVVCGTCLDFYGLKEKLRAGRVSNMYEIQGILMSADRLIST